MSIGGPRGVQYRLANPNTGDHSAGPVTDNRTASTGANVNSQISGGLGEESPNSQNNRAVDNGTTDFRQDLAYSVSTSLLPPDPSAILPEPMAKRHGYSPTEAGPAESRGSMKLFSFTLEASAAADRVYTPGVAGRHSLSSDYGPASLNSTGSAAGVPFADSMISLSERSPSIGSDGTVESNDKNSRGMSIEGMCSVQRITS